jgi:peptidoglycan/xylan/chitin deacetylase (PgdA/CDA1 family)
LVNAERAKQLLKNGLYRTIGETTRGVGVVNGSADGALRVLMYHKVNDRPENRMSVPVSLFDEQLDQLRQLGYTVVGLEAVLAHYGGGDPLPPRSVLITFDDGYRDNLENALPVLQRYGYPSVLFVPIGYLDEERPLPHEERLAASGILNPTLRWTELAELETGGMRIESHGISHKPLADLELDEAAREIALSKLRLEERLGRPGARSPTSRAPRRTTTRCT